MNWYLAALRKYATFAGRSRRMEYWMFTLLNVVFGVIISVAEYYVGTGGIIGAIYALAMLIPGLAVSVRRLHDTSHSGWWIFINLVPLIGWLWFLYLMFKDSDPGANAHGPNPKGMAAAA